jgi:hypothetical protein
MGSFQASNIQDSQVISKVDNTKEYSTFYITSLQDDVYHSIKYHCDADILISIKDSDIINYKICNCTVIQDKVIPEGPKVLPEGPKVIPEGPKVIPEGFKVVPKGPLLIIPPCTGTYMVLYKATRFGMIYHRIKGHVGANEPVYMTEQEYMCKRPVTCSKCDVSGITTSNFRPLYKMADEANVYHRTKYHYTAKKEYYLTREETTKALICSRC